MAEMDNFTTFKDNSTETPSCILLFDTVDFKVQAALRSVIGLFSCVCCALVVFIIVLFKKYKFYSQRLILYLAITAAIHAFSYSLTRVNYYTPREIEDRYCFFGGLLNHYTAANEVLSVCFMTLNLVVKALCRRSTVKAEPVIVVVIFLLPASWYWVPLWLNAYGTAGGWCTIRTLNSDCTRYEYEPWLQLGLRYIPLYSLMLLTLVSIVLVAMKTTTCTRTWTSTKWVGRWDPVAETAARQKLKKDIRLVIWYPIIFILFNIFALINQIFRAAGSKPPSFLIYCRIFTSTIRGAVIALAFALDSETRQRLRPAQCKASCLEWLGRRETVEEYAFDSAAADYMESYRSVPYCSAGESELL